MSRWALISGEDRDGNIACALKVVRDLEAAGVRCAGFVQRRYFDEEENKRYEVVRLRNDESAVLAVNGAVARRPGEEIFCDMAYRRDGFETARKWLAEDAQDADLLLVDGVSKLEASGKGHHATLEAALRRTGQDRARFRSGEPALLRGGEVRIGGRGSSGGARAAGRRGGLGRVFSRSIERLSPRACESATAKTIAGIIRTIPIRARRGRFASRSVLVLNYLEGEEPLWKKGA